MSNSSIALIVLSSILLVYNVVGFFYLLYINRRKK